MFKSCIKRGKSDKIFAGLKTSPGKSLAQHVEQTNFSTSPQLTVIKLLHWHPHKTIVVHKLYNADSETKLIFVCDVLQTELGPIHKFTLNIRPVSAALKSALL